MPQHATVGPTQVSVAWVLQGTQLLPERLIGTLRLCGRPRSVRLGRSPRGVTALRGLSRYLVLPVAETALGRVALSAVAQDRFGRARSAAARLAALYLGRDGALV